MTDSVHLAPARLRALSQRSNARGLVQALGVLLAATLTGASTLLFWRSGHPWLALGGLIAHGNICSLFISAVHELAHGTVFKSRRLGAFFLWVFGTLNWMDGEDYFATHKGHHADTLYEHDPELAGACRPLWLGTWLWSLGFNFPRMFVSFARCPVALRCLHVLLATAFVSCGVPELIILVNLAPFYFGWIELLLNYPQHAGLEVGASDLRHSTRSLRLPAWLSFLHWRMEYHLDHHLFPSVPCYHLPELRAALGDQLPPRETLFTAWHFILRNRFAGRCGSGPHPLARLGRASNA